MSSKYTAPRMRRKMAGKPNKPYSTFPLTPHASGKWQKKIRGQIHYFGNWARHENGKLVRIDGDGWKEALELYKSQADDLHAGRTPRLKNDGLTLAELCNRFLTAKQRTLQSGELSHRTFAEYKQTTDKLIAQFGKARLVDDLAAEDFELLRSTIAKRCGPVRLGNEVTRVKSVFKYAVDNKLIDRPVTFGSEFKKPGKSVMRKHRAASGKKLFTAAEVRTLLDTSSPQLKAAILLGVNAGLGNTDVANVQKKHVDNDWLDFPRVKTGLPRRVPLWRETTDALKIAVSQRPKPSQPKDAGCLFLTAAGTRWVRVTDKSRTDYLSREFGKILREMKINGRKGLNFYSLRHTFASVALQTGDRDACRSLMGHAAHDMLSAYDETGPSDDRLRAVADQVHQWLFGTDEAT
jgi:integrase